MKITLSILSILLLACAAPENNIPTDILSEKAFENILKEIHLAEGTFELNKSKNMENAKANLKNSYTSIYSEYKISAIDFENTLNYYTKHPEKLEKIYGSVLDQLIEERSILDQQ